MSVVLYHNELTNQYLCEQHCTCTDILSKHVIRLSTPQQIIITEDIQKHANFVLPKNATVFARSCEICNSFITKLYIKERNHKHEQGHIEKVLAARCSSQTSGATLPATLPVTLHSLEAVLQKFGYKNEAALYIQYGRELANKHYEDTVAERKNGKRSLSLVYPEFSRTDALDENDVNRLIGLKIKRIRTMTQKEQHETQFDKYTTVVEMDDNTKIFSISNAFILLSST
jgi:pyruvoyl-dependent arginine decarboxylase (PvlArgDC)